VTAERSFPHRQNEGVSLRAKGASERVVVERLRTEATNWINAVALQSGRIGRRSRKQYPEQLEVQALEVDLHFFLVTVIRLRRRIEGTARRVSGLDAPLGRRLRWRASVVAQTQERERAH
jgi:hypothetical protein